MPGLKDSEGSVEIHRSSLEQTGLPDDSGEWEEKPDLPDDSGDHRTNRLLPDTTITPRDGGTFLDSHDGMSEETETESDDTEMVGDTQDVKEIMQPPIVIVFKCPPDLDPVEFERQLSNQKDGLNKQTLAENIENRENYAANGRDVSDGAEAQKRARQEAYQDRIAECRKNGMSFTEAKADADDWIKTQAALHDPDQIAGGNPTNVTGVGDSRVNSSIGAQWKENVKILDDAVKAYIEDNNLSTDDCKQIKLNVSLEVKS